MSETVQKPSIGRVVIFVLPESDKEQKLNNFGDEAPAIVTRVFDSGLVNLKVHFDGPADGWRTSVKYSEEPVPYSWHWPPRV